MPTSKAADRAMRLREQAKQKMAKAQRLEALERERMRRKETRRKIVLGAAISSLMSSDDQLKLMLLSRLHHHVTLLRDREILGLDTDNE